MKPKPLVRAAQYVALLVVVVVFTAPTLWMLLGVFKRNVEHRAHPPVLIPSDPIGAASDTIRPCQTASNNSSLLTIRSRCCTR